jgi:hypothetical protein
MTAKWRIVVGSDNAGINYKNALKAMLLGDPRVTSKTSASRMLATPRRTPTSPWRRQRR